MAERKIRSDKKINVNPSLTQDAHDKLNRLAISCSMTKTQLAAHLLTMAVNNPEIIKHYQDRFNKVSQYRVIPVQDKDGNVFY